jgi:hypothetical protein
MFTRGPNAKYFVITCFTGWMDFSVWYSVMNRGLLSNSRFCLQGQLYEKVRAISLHLFLILCNLCIFLTSVKCEIYPIMKFKIIIFQQVDYFYLKAVTFVSVDALCAV